MLFKRNRVIIKSLLENYEGKLETTLNIYGWIQSIRKQSDLVFINLNDGSGTKNLQIIICPEIYQGEISEIINDLNIGVSIYISGKLIKSPAKGQEVELQAYNCNILGTVDLHTYPLPKTALTTDYLRQIPHMRIRRQLFASVARVRDSASFYTHLFFRNNDFKNINTPVITSGDCEGAGEQFVITTLLNDKVSEIPQNEGLIDYNKDFFGRKVNLTVSGQLHAETYASSLGDVYTFGPTFRAEDSNTSRHLAEFWMLEMESAFMDLENLMNISEDYIKFIISEVLKNNINELELLTSVKKDNENLITNLKNILESEFIRISYTEVINILENDIKEYKVLVKENYPDISDKDWKKKSKNKNVFEFRPYWGCDLASEHERYICEKKFNKPCIVYNYPKNIKAFYMKQNTDKTVQAMDILVPGVGELIGGSVRESSYDKIVQRIDELDICKENISWYLDLRKYGSAHSAGFGLGFERLIMYLTGNTNIKDCISYPRYPQSIFA